MSFSEEGDHGPRHSSDPGVVRLVRRPDSRLRLERESIEHSMNSAQTRSPRDSLCSLAATIAGWAGRLERGEALVDSSRRDSSKARKKGPVADFAGLVESAEMPGYSRTKF